MAEFPVAGIVCLAVGAYVAIIIGIIVLCYFLKGRGRCKEANCCAKEEGAQSCECCIAMSEACNCCKGPSINSCLNSCCPNRKHISCVDIIMCQCCSSDGTTFCDCCKRPDKEERETCNCLCLEIRLRSSPDKDELNTARPLPASGTKHAWMSSPSPYFRSIGDVQGEFDRYNDLQLDLGWFHNAAYPISTHPINTNRSETSGDFVPTSTPRFHQGQSQLFIRPGVHSAGRVIAKRQSGQWPSARRLSSRRRSSRRSRSLPHRSASRRRSSRVTGNVRPAVRRQSQREPGMQESYSQERYDME